MTTLILSALLTSQRSSSGFPWAMMISASLPVSRVPSSFSRIITIEDGIRKGGMGTAILEFMSDNEYTPHVHRIGVPDKFVEHGTIQELYHLCGMDEEGILEAININCHDKERINKDI